MIFKSKYRRFGNNKSEFRQSSRNRRNQFINFQKTKNDHSQDIGLRTISKIFNRWCWWINFKSLQINIGPKNSKAFSTVSLNGFCFFKELLSYGPYGLRLLRFPNSKACHGATTFVATFATLLCSWSFWFVTFKSTSGASKVILIESFVGNSFWNLTLIEIERQFA